MLEDMCVAVAELGTVFFQVSKKKLYRKSILKWVIVAVRMQNGKRVKKSLFPPGIEPGTLRV